MPPPPPADDDSDDDFGPSLPPDLAEARRAGPVAGPSLPTKTVLGPSLPPGFAPPSAPRRETPLSAAYLDDDDDSFGPMPLPAGMKADDNDGARAFREREEREAEKRRKEAAGKGKPQREEWMLVPPKEMDLMSSACRFLSLALRAATDFKRRSDGHDQAQVAHVPAVDQGRHWTQAGRAEPLDRDTRRAPTAHAGRAHGRQAQGRERQPGRGRVGRQASQARAGLPAQGGGRAPQRAPSPSVTAVRRRLIHLAAFQKSARNTSMLDAHSKSGKKADPKEKEVPGIWDRDRDMSVGGRLMDGDKRADIVKSAKELGGRFGGGSYL